MGWRLHDEVKVLSTRPWGSANQWSAFAFAREPRCCPSRNERDGPFPRFSQVLGGSGGFRPCDFFGRAMLSSEESIHLYP